MSRHAAGRAPAVNAVRRELLVQQDAQLSTGMLRSPTQEQAERVTDLALAAAPATQVRKPWRATVRTLLQVIVGLAPMLPAIVNASGVDATAAPVAGALAISAGVARVMALSQVEAFLQRFVPWLAASPRPSGL